MTQHLCWLWRDALTVNVMTQVPRQNLVAFQIPAALIIVVIGLFWTLLRNPAIVGALRLGPSRPQVVVPTRHQWYEGE